VLPVRLGHLLRVSETALPGGQFKVEPDEREIRVYSEQGRIEAALLKCIGADTRNCGSGGLLPIQAIPLERTRFAVDSAT
jgi:hypothetical protein